MNPLILALDVPDAATALSWIDRLGSRIGCYKIGLRLFIAEGPGLVRAVRQRGHPVFLDLKLHDIPNTVAAAVESAGRLDVQFLTLHTLGGGRMLQAAAAAATPFPGLHLLGVTVLTSHSPQDLASLGLPDSLESQALRLARLGAAAGLHGLVCSPHELASFRRELPPSLLLVTPGIRPPGSPAGDQVRTATPREALQAGANHLVVGRPVLEAADPLAAADLLLQ